MTTRIAVDPKICHGKPIIRGTRIMVWQIIDLKACLEFANHLIKNEDIHLARENK